VALLLLLAFLFMAAVAALTLLEQFQVAAVDVLRRLTQTVQTAALVVLLLQAGNWRKVWQQFLV